MKPYDSVYFWRLVKFLHENLTFDRRTPINKIFWHRVFIIDQITTPENKAKFMWHLEYYNENLAGIGHYRHFTTDDEKNKIYVH